ncbi:MAG: hypothetical protein COU81_00255 [Candidatus Portnoybacteria bacterium CG10_big_fil_rev_8_21_14_0_10_36_7]|uniref:Multidrug resistance protein MdtA-like C-terminal permuted SH3 domain-containing protein n=1 Tax=Candidatus Portnoybacteria bacterium CG10_big_fil_rev_8_21_14_0_10_36_7 TaxID=1974812 RepID=A0A2M8KF37_9BACT|nr:MAG: hypothetical protein COU81_00255 [Candidatus Portnoybacteria bacterium CG10_big_fil_rev_8_21_14_0_10_36_7]
MGFASSNSSKNLELKQATPRQIDIDLYEGQVKQAQASVSAASEQLSQAILRSPINGKVSQIDIKIGEITGANSNAISVINTQNFDIEADIPETDIGKISILNPVEITYDAFSEDPIKMDVIASIDPAEISIEGVVYYKVTITLDEQDDKLRSGLTANINIISKQKENVIAIPQRAVIEKIEGEKIAKILKGSTVSEIQIETGLRSTDGNIEILSGINEGDVVITAETK